MSQEEINDKAKDLVSSCHEAGAECIVLVGFKDGATIRAADGPMPEILLLNAIGLIQWGERTNNDAVEMAKALVDTVKEIKKDMSNQKWKGSNDLGGKKDD